jgi:hypothetical protein
LIGARGAGVDGGDQRRKTTAGERKVSWKSFQNFIF